MLKSFTVNLIRLWENILKCIHAREYSRLEKANSAVRYKKHRSVFAILDYRKLILSTSNEHVTIFSSRQSVTKCTSTLSVTCFAQVRIVW